MPSALDRRLNRIEAAIGGANQGPGVVYCRTDSDAERVWSEAKAAGRTSPMCMVTAHETGPAVIEGPTMTDLLASIEAHGRRFHDPLPEGYKLSSAYLWRPPREKLARAGRPRQRAPRKSIVR